MSFFAKLFGFFRRNNIPTPSSRTERGGDPDVWQPIQRDYSQIHAPHKAVNPSLPLSGPGHEPVPPTIPSATGALPNPPQTRPAPKQAIVVATRGIPPSPAMVTLKVPEPKPTDCPHGKRRREFCPICDPDGFAENFGNWETD
jgi:hypothetical protein